VRRMTGAQPRENPEMSGKELQTHVFKRLPLSSRCLARHLLNHGREGRSAACLPSLL
jgi:hypothetical protein